MTTSADDFFDAFGEPNTKFNPSTADTIIMVIDRSVSMSRI